MAKSDAREIPEPRADERARSESAGASGWAIAAAAGVAAIVASAISWSVLPVRAPTGAPNSGAEIEMLRARIDMLQQQVDQSGNKLAAIESRLGQATDLIVATGAPDARVAHLSPTAAAPNAGGLVALSAAQGAAMLQVTGLPPTPDDKEYEVWWIGEKSGALKAGLFQPLSEGATLVALALPPAGEAMRASLITLEQRGGTGQPTGASFLQGDFPHH